METSLIPYEFLCPISLQIYLNPYTAEDGFDYEYDQIVRWQEINNTSPMTGDLMGYNLIKNYNLKNRVLNYLENNKEFVSEQYKRDFDLFPGKIIQDMRNRKYYKIKKYKNINLSLLKFALCDLTKEEEYAIHLIDHSNHKIADCGKNSKLIHYICKFSNLKVLKYAHDQGLDFESQDNNGWKPLHIVCKDKNIEKINFLLDKVDINSQVNGWTPMHILSYLRMYEQVITLLKLEPNLYLENNKGVKSIEIINSNKHLKELIMLRGISL